MSTLNVKKKKKKKRQASHTEAAHVKAYIYTQPSRDR